MDKEVRVTEQPELNCPMALIGRGAALALGLASATVLTPIGAQTSVTADGACTSCIVQRHVVRLGEANGPGIIESEITTVVRDGQGRFLTVNPMAPHSIAVYAPDGTFMKRVGRRGRGPGEYEFLYGRLLPISPDTVLAFDQALSRLTLLNRDMDVISTSRVDAHPLSFVDLTAVNGPRPQLILSAAIRTAQRIGLPLHRLSLTGEIEGSFGSPSEVFRADIPHLDTRFVVAGQGGTVWGDRLRFEQWTVQGELRHVLQRDVPWFDEAARNGTGEPDPRAPLPQVNDIERDPEGRIWVMYSVPDEKWEDAVSTGGPHGFSVEDYHGYWDTVVEVIDPEEARVVAMRRFDSNSFYFLRPIEIAVITLLDDEPYLDIWRLTLGPPQ